VGKHEIEKATAAQHIFLADPVVGREQDASPCGDLGVSVAGDKLGASGRGEGVFARAQTPLPVELEAKAAELATAVIVIGLELFTPSLRVYEDAAAAPAGGGESITEVGSADH
jgi:hypothetical protein